MPDVQLPSFHDFTFGYTSAASEASRDPTLLTHGFVDLGGVIDRLRRSDHFIVLGNKGTGKSAIAEHLKLSADTDAKTFVKVASLADFPYSNLKTLVDGDEAEHPFPSAWSWLLLVNFLASFAHDEGSNTWSDPELSEVHAALMSAGLLPSPCGLKELLDISRKRFKIEFAGVSLQAEDRKQRDLNLPFFVEKLRSALLRFTSDSFHLLVLDDLDEVLNMMDVQLQPLATLVSESFRINDSFRRADVPAKIILLCRTDLFDRLPGSNTNKLRQDYSIRLNWYTPHQDSSPLWTVANRRASVQCGHEIDIAETYFPPELQQRLGKIRVLPKQPVETSRYLLRHTRFTPRDFVMLLSYIQRHTHGDSVQSDEIAAALQEYATEYFVPEIRNELGGYLQPSEVATLIHAFGTMGDGLFELAQIEEGVPEPLRQKLPQILGVLFDCSAIGNWERREAADLRMFKYKSPNYSLNLSQPMVLHPALGVAFNIADPLERGVRADNLLAWPVGERIASSDLNGEVKKTRPQHGDGLIVSPNREVFYYRNSDVDDNTRLCQGDLVTFQRAPRAGPKAAYCSAVRVRLLGRHPKAPGSVRRVDAE